MISWAVMGYGAALSVLLVPALTAIPKPRQPRMIATAAASLALGFGPLAGQPGRRLAVTATLAGLAAFLVDVYLY
jgi:hypothetical protein